MDLNFEEIDEHVKKFVELRSKLDLTVKQNVEVAQARQKKHYDSRHQQGSYKVGNIVLLKNMKKLSKKGDKLKPNWTGPYDIAECLGKNNYRLKKRTGKKVLLKSVYNSTRLKLYYKRGTGSYNVIIEVLTQLFLAVCRS